MNLPVTVWILVFCTCIGALGDPIFTEELSSEGIIDFYITDRNHANVTSVVALGSQLYLNLVLSGTESYSALIPYECYFEDANDKSQHMQFVDQNCPMPTVSPLATMRRINDTAYQMPFLAFAFSPAPIANLAIYCQITLCISSNIGDFCNASCWDYPPEPKYFNQELSIGDGKSHQRSVRANDGGRMSKVINLIITDKNYTTPIGGRTTPMPPPSMLYVMYGVAGFFAFLFLVLLIGIIAFLCCSPKPAKSPRVIYPSPPPVSPSAPPAQYYMPGQQVDPVFSNLPGQAPYCDWYTVYRIPRVWTDRTKPDPGSAVSIDGDGSGSSDGGPSSGSGGVTSQKGLMNFKRDKGQKKVDVAVVEDPRLRGRDDGPIRYVVM